MKNPETSVLADALRRELDSVTVHAAVFTTFTFEWSFMLDHVLPVLVPHGLSARARRRREEVADHFLEQGTAITVYHDAGQIADATHASRIPVVTAAVAQPHGCVFHPKVALLLVDDGEDRQDQVRRLVVCVSSANLTRAGWATNVEAAHVWTIEDRESIWCRDSLLAFLDHLLAQSRPASARDATRRIREFLESTSQRTRRSGRDGDLGERFLWNGARQRASFVDQVFEVTRDQFAGGLLEVISPWYSDSALDQARELASSLGVARSVILAPRDQEGASLVPAAAATDLVDGETWGSLGNKYIRAGVAAEAKLRQVHAKVYRLTRRGHGRETAVVGSFNLTDKAFGADGNLEAAVLIESKSPVRPATWLDECTTLPQLAPANTDHEDDPVPTRIQSPLQITYDWRHGIARCAWLSDDEPVDLVLRCGAVEVVSLAAADLAGDLAEAQTAVLGRHLRSASPLLDVAGHGDALEYTMVEELHVGQKPSVEQTRTLADAIGEILTDRETLRARESRKVDEDTDLEEQDGDSALGHEEPSGSMLDTVAAIYEAFGVLRRTLQTLVAAESDREIEHRLRNESSGCLGDFLSRAEDLVEDDPTAALVLCWSVEDLLDGLVPGLPRRHEDAVNSTRDRAERIRRTIESSLVASTPGDPDMGRFLDWARKNFGRHN